jgi:prepilin-type N-terminal cleavage/methylation domain-containing protein
MKPGTSTRRTQLGFTLIEMLIAVAIMAIVSAGILAQMDIAQQRGFSEQVKLDNFQEARDFVDQFFRDINQIGYPNSRLVNTDPLTSNWSPLLSTPAAYTWLNPYANDNRLAIGLVSIDAQAIQFEGDMNGNGAVQTVIYQVNGGGSCSLCLQRSQADKITGNSLPTPTGAQTPNWGTEVNDVLSNPIFSYFKADGTQIPNSSLPLDISTSAGATALASVKTIKIGLVIRNPLILDPNTHQAIETNFEGEVSINNCSMAKTGQTSSC